MARLPIPGGDDKVWGQILNDFLETSLNADGTLKPIDPADVGLDNVDNTSDANKPVSTAAQTALDTKLAKAGDTMSGDLVMGSNKVTEVTDGTDNGDAANVGQLAAAIADVESDLTSVGTEITDLPTATRTDASWQPVYQADENYIPIVQEGVAKKMPLELITTMAPSVGAVVSGTTHTWSPGEVSILCNNASALVVTLPTFASSPGLNAPIMITRMGAGSVTLFAANPQVIINKAASLPLTLRQQFSVAYFWPYFWTGGTTVYLAWGDLG